MILITQTKKLPRFTSTSTHQTQKKKQKKTVYRPHHNECIPLIETNKNAYHKAKSKYQALRQRSQILVTHGYVSDVSTQLMPALSKAWSSRSQTASGSCIPSPNAMPPTPTYILIPPPVRQTLNEENVTLCPLGHYTIGCHLLHSSFPMRGVGTNCTLGNTAI